MSLLGWLLAAHLVCASGATVAFWSAASFRKGGIPHRRAGRWFARFVMLTAGSGALMAIWRLLVSAIRADLTPAARAELHVMWLVLYVLVILVAPVQHGLAVVAAGPVPGRVRSRSHAVLCSAAMLASVALLPAAIVWQEWLFLLLMPIGFIVGLRNLSYATRRSATPVTWRREHLTSMLTAGIVLHTALLVFGTSRSLGLDLSGGWQVVPWILPTLIGLPVIAWLRR